MVLWGVIWGAVLGFFLDRNHNDGGFILGALLGAWAGISLRKAVRREVQLQAQRLAVPVVQVPEPVTAPAPETQSEAVPTMPMPLDAPATAPATAAAAAAAAAAAPVAPGKPAMPRARAEPRIAGPSEPLPPAKPSLAEQWIGGVRGWLLGGNTIVRMGVLVLFIGLAFLAKYAADHALLPPELRLAAVGLVGCALLVAGWRLRLGQERALYALTLQGAGVAVLYLTVFASFRLYPFLSAGSAFALMAVVCALSTAIALLQNAQTMAFVGFAGAFAAPVLVSTGQGDHVGLFSYYLLLGAAIAVVAWMRAWRALNLLGFFATFGVASLWGVLKYNPALFDTTEPFLLGFFALYLAATLAYATRHSLRPRQAVDGTLVFGLPIVTMALQSQLVRDMPYATALSSLALGALYLALGWWAALRRGSEHDAGVGRWLAECFAALGLGFVTLAVPLALDGRWTSAVWAAEGAAVYWMGQRQGRWLARLAGLALQPLAALSYLGALGRMSGAQWPLANPGFVGAVWLAASALALAYWMRPVDAARAPASGSDLHDQAPWRVSGWQAQFQKFEQVLSPLFFWVGFLWWVFGCWQEIEHWIVDDAQQARLIMLVWLGSAWVALRAARLGLDGEWPVAATPVRWSLLWMGIAAGHGLVAQGHVLEGMGWLVWPLALLLHAVALRQVDDRAPRAWWSWVHTGGVWLIVLLGGNVLLWAVRQSQLQGTAWAAVILLVASVAVLLALTARRLHDPASRWRQRWPLGDFADAYLWRAAAPLALAVGLGALLVAVHSDGNARPLPYVPLLNPTDITVALALAACALWRMRLVQGTLAVPAAVHSARWIWVLAGVGFVAFNTVWLRAVHHWAGVRWNAQALFDSFLVQTGYSILWSLLALGLMLWAVRRVARTVWMSGAGLLGLVVLKLFVVDLSNRGGSERIVAFIAVGVLMLVVGYFAPLPPATPRVAGEPQPEQEHA